MHGMSSSGFSSKSRDFGSGSCCCCGCLELVFSFMAMIFLFVVGMKALCLSWEDVIGESRKRSDNDWDHGILSSMAMASPRHAQCQCYESHTRRKQCEEGGHEGQARCEESTKEEVVEIKKALMAERERHQDACLELEKERKAAASSLDSAMAMIFKLQNEMSLSQLEARQFRELAKEKQNHDREVIEHLKWVILNAESMREVVHEDGQKLLDQMASNQDISIGNRSEGDENILVVGRKRGQFMTINHIDKIREMDANGSSLTPTKGDFLNGLKSSLDFDSHTM